MYKSQENLDDLELKTRLIGLRGALRDAIDDDARVSDLDGITRSINECEAEIERRRHSGTKGVP